MLRRTMQRVYDHPCFPLALICAVGVLYGVFCLALYRAGEHEAHRMDARHGERAEVGR